MNIDTSTNISNVNKFMSIFRDVLDGLFVQKNHKLNAGIVISKLKEKNISINKIQSLMKELPEGEWNIKTFLTNIHKLDEIFLLSDEQIQNYGINVKNKDIGNIRWEILIESMLDYSKFSKEFYDALKYNKTAGLSVAKITLLNELMMTFKYINDLSKALFNKYEHKKYTKAYLDQFNKERIAIEFLMLRVLYISMNLKGANNNKFEEFARLLGTERIAITYHKQIIPKFS